MKNLLIQRLRAEQCSCVILNHGTTRIFHQKGVKDLHHLLRTDPSFLAGAMVADKVVGKGAAALLVAGGVGRLYAEGISRRAWELLNKHICPVEKRCLPCNSIEECLRQIDNFFEVLDHKA